MSKKIFYVGGIISLIFIPFLLFYFAKPAYDKLNLRVIDFGLPYKLKNGETENLNKIPIEGWNYQTIILPNNFSLENEKDYSEKIKTLQLNNVEKTGIRFQFSDSNNYNDFIRLVTLMYKTKQETYGLDTENTNSFYVVHFKKEKNKTYFQCNVVNIPYFNQEDYNFKTATFFEKATKYTSKEIYYLIIGFLVLTYFSLVRLIKFNKKHYS